MSLNKYVPDKYHVYSSIKKEISEQVDLTHIDIDVENPLKYVLDTSEMKYETMKMFNKIKYGY